MLHVGIKRLSIAIIPIRVHKHVLFGHSLVTTDKSHFVKIKRNFTKRLTSLGLATSNTACVGLHYYMSYYLKPNKYVNTDSILQTHRLQ